MSAEKEGKLLQCYNRGCGQSYDPSKNTNESCCHHPGEPYFHDVYKGWSCCNKKSVDFTEFLNIKGCTLSKHSNVKPPEPEKPQRNDNDKDEVIEVRAPIPIAMERPPIDSTMTTIEPIVDRALKATVDGMQKTTVVAAPAEAVNGIPIGSACKNHGCTSTYKGANVDHGECQHHPGVPIFHEGMKYWSCCQKKTTDFAVFMSQQGCSYAEHKWAKENDDKKAVECRYDWHQTGSDVIVSIYAKKYHYAQSKIEVNPIRLHVNLVFPEQNNAKYDLDLELRGIIDVAKTSVHMFGTKVEITMRKAEAGSWSKLDFPRSKLPPPQNTSTNTTTTSKASVKNADSEDDDSFNLDDIDTVKSGDLSLSITEIEKELD